MPPRDLQDASVKHPEKSSCSSMGPLTHSPTGGRRNGASEPSKRPQRGTPRDPHANLRGPWPTAELGVGGIA
eukprot:4609427-Pyramimonas_sp.AAC.1